MTNEVYENQKEQPMTIHVFNPKACPRNVELVLSQPPTGGADQILPS